MKVSGPKSIGRGENKTVGNTADFFQYMTSVDVNKVQQMHIKNVTFHPSSFDQKQEHSTCSSLAIRYEQSYLDKSIKYHTVLN